ncbi:hypothetical protein [Actinoplanes sp. NPDC026670]|uniref:hypothetical protein n=1 Tax=Actinoplanes sp. NPDC026670 TaxID=3154700 RepID=UPI0034022B9F
MTSLSRRTVLKGAALSSFAWTASPAHATSAPTTAPLDTVVFGDTASETRHGLTTDLSTKVTGGLGQSARTLDPRTPAEWWGGSVGFTVAVAPTGTTYLSIKLFGEDFAAPESEWRLQAFIDGAVLGWFEQGPVDNLDLMSQHPRRINGFFLHTLPLPETVTAERRSVRIEIRAVGRIYAYGTTDAAYFRPMTTPSRGIYRAYTHTEPYFRPGPRDDFGTSPEPTLRPAADTAVVADIRRRVLADQTALLHTARAHTLDAWGFITLAEGYHWADSPAYRQPRALSRVCQAIDGRYLAWKADPAVLTASDQQWQGFGRVGLALCTLWEDIQDELDRPVSTGPTDLLNPGFDAGLGGWSTTVWRGTGTAAAVDGTVVVTAAAGSLAGVTSANNRTLIGQGTHRYTVRVKTDGAAYLDVLFYDAAGKLVGTDNKFAATPGDWTTAGGELRTPATAAQVRIDLRVEGAGTAAFDDVRIEALADAQPPGSGGQPLRRDAYREMLLASREYWRRNQRHYTNQVQILAIGVYQANRGLRLLSPDDAWPEAQARRWLYEAVGLEPLSFDGDYLLGHDYRIATPKGLTRELGYVGTYGEVTDWLVAIWESLTVGPDGSEDAVLRDQILKIVKTRGWFRFPGVDDDGHRAMRLEQVIGWRNEHYPGDMVYAQRTAWDGHPLEAVATFGDPELTGWAQQMIADGQFAPQLKLLLTNTSRRVGLNAFHLISRDLAAFERLPTSPHRLPGGWDRPDFVFTDETAGAVAIKRGQEILYASLYWRARQAINNWGRVHLITPQSERSGTIRLWTRGGTDGTFTVADWTTTDYAINDGGGTCSFAGGGRTPPGEPLRQAFLGYDLSTAPVPEDMDPYLGCPRASGIEGLEVGRAPFYQLEYGGYLIAMNTTTDRTFTFRSGRSGTGIDLRTGRRVPLSRPVQVGPQSTVVYFDPA